MAASMVARVSLKYFSNATFKHKSAISAFHTSACRQGKAKQKYIEAPQITSVKRRVPNDRKKLDLVMAPEVNSARLATKTEEDQPRDDVYLMSYYNTPVYSLLEAIEMHREYADPTMLDNMEGLLYLEMELDMKTKKKTRFLSDINTQVMMPHQFTKPATDKRIVAFCKDPADAQIALEMGAMFAGHTELIKQISLQEIPAGDIDACICTLETIPDIVPIRKKLAHCFPKKQDGNLGSNVADMMDLLLLGYVLQSEKIYLNVSRVKAAIGKVNFTNEQLLSNVDTLLQTLCTHHSKMNRTTTNDQFIMKCKLTCKPSVEEFDVDISEFISKDMNKSETQSESLESRNEDDSDSDEEVAV